MKEEEEGNTYYYSRYHQRGGAGAFILLFLGIIFLLNNFGILPWSSWNYLWRLWPLFLIVAGIRMILGRSQLSYILSTIISLVLIIFAILVALAPSNPTVADTLNHYMPGLLEHINIPDNNQTPGAQGNYFSY